MVSDPTLQLVVSEIMSLPKEIVIKDETYSLSKIPDEESAVVKEETAKLLGAVNLKSLVTNLGRVGSFIRIAYNGVGAAGPKFTQQQIEIQSLGYDVTKLWDKSALTVSKFKKASSSVVVDRLQATYEYLLNNQELEMHALETLSAFFKLAEDMERAAFELHKDFEVEQEKVVKILKSTQRAKELEKEFQMEIALKVFKEQEKLYEEGQRKESKQNMAESEQNMAEFADYSLHLAIGALMGLSIVMIKAAIFWEQISKSLAEDEMQKLVEKVMKYPEENRLRVWTSMGFKKKAIQFCAGWVALGVVCRIMEVCIENIKETQQDLVQYFKKCPTYKESRVNIKELAEKLLRELRHDQKELTDKLFEFEAEEEIKPIEYSEAAATPEKQNEIIDRMESNFQRLIISFNNLHLSPELQLSNSDPRYEASLKTLTCTLNHVLRLTLPLSSAWHNMGVLLGVDTGTLEKIDYDHRNADDCLREMLQEWLKQVNPRPSWEALAEAVEPFDPSIAQEIRRLVTPS